MSCEAEISSWTMYAVPSAISAASWIASRLRTASCVKSSDHFISTRKLVSTSKDILLNLFISGFGARWSSSHAASSDAHRATWSRGSPISNWLCRNRWSHDSITATSIFRSKDTAWTCQRAKLKRELSTRTHKCRFFPVPITEVVIERVPPMPRSHFASTGSNRVDM